MENQKNYLKVSAESTDNWLNQSVKEIEELIDLNAKETIRYCFDLGLIDTNMLAAIQVAKDKGYHDLAKEMIADMEEMEADNA